MSNRLKRKKASKSQQANVQSVVNFFGLVLHLQRSECVAVARNANVPQVPHDNSFKRAAIGNQHDEDQWELNHSWELMIIQKKTNAETDKNIGWKI